MIKVLVCGSRGSLMKYIVRDLKKLNFEVVGVDNLSGPGNYEDLTDEHRFYPTDLRNYEEVLEIVRLEKPRIIIQGAALVYGAVGLRKHPADILSNEIEITSNLLRAFTEVENRSGAPNPNKNRLKKFIYLSSSMVYESSPIPHLEKHAEMCPPMKTYYGFSKHVGEKLVRAYHKQYNLEYTIWRPFNIINPDEIAGDDHGISHVYADFLRKILIHKQNPLPIIGDGMQTRTFTWVEDASLVIAGHALNPRSRNRSFNLAGRNNVTMKALANMIHSLGIHRGILPISTEVMRLEFISVKEFNNEVTKRWPNTSKIEKHLNVVLDTDLPVMLGRCIDRLFP